MHGEEVLGGEVYPFIAERLNLLIGHDGFEQANNVVARPIYLPPLDVANGKLIDPLRDTTVAPPTIPGASVFVEAGSLQDRQGNAFVGVLSITEVPVDRTPAALPAGMFPDIVVTIQPGDMVFATPAPLTLPNLSGILPGAPLSLMSINPITGAFDQVGTGRVRADGLVIETVEGGVRNSSWHFFNLTGPTLDDPQQDVRNQDKNCDDNCESRDAANADAAPTEGSGPDIGGDNEQSGPSNEDGSSPGDTAQPNQSVDVCELTAYCYSIREEGAIEESTSDAPSVSAKTARHTANELPFQSFRPEAVTKRGQYHRHQSRACNLVQVPPPRPTRHRSRIAFGCVFYKRHRLAPYYSLQTWRGVELHYDSERADPRPIIHARFSDVENSLPEVNLISKLAIMQGDFRYEVPGYPGDTTGRLTGGEHFFDVPDGASTLDVSLQADLRSVPSGLLRFESTHRFARAASQWGGTASTTAEGELVHVNTIDSPFGAGWGLAGLLELVANADGSLLLVDGAGGERLFQPPTSPGSPYESPPGDFTLLRELSDGTYQRKDTTGQIQVFQRQS